MTSSPDPKGLARASARAVGASRFATPIARALVVAAGLLLLAIIGHVAAAQSSAIDVPQAAPATARASPPLEPGLSAVTGDAASPESVGRAPPPQPSGAAAASPASPGAPVVLNTASLEDLKRLPGVGEKRGTAILALRGRLGRFHAVEDLLKVKGIGRASLKRIRALVRIDPDVAPDAGAPP